MIPVEPTQATQVTQPAMNVWQMLVVVAPAIAAAVIAYLSRRDVKDLHLIVNSRLTQLLEATSAQRFAEGRAEGASGGRISQKADDAETRLQASMQEPTNAGPTNRPAVIASGQAANTAALRENTAATNENTGAGAKGKP